MGFQDIAFQPSRASFSTTSLKNCGRGESLGTTTSLKNCGRGESLGTTTSLKNCGRGESLGTTTCLKLWLGVSNGMLRVTYCAPTKPPFVLVEFHGS